MSAPPVRARSKAKIGPLTHAAADLVEHIGRRLQNLAYAEGLNPAQWTLLRFLARANPSARTLTSFARFHLTTKSTAKQTIDALHRKRLIRSAKHPVDRRVRPLELTATGSTILARDPMNHLIAALARLSEPDLHQFARIVAGLAQDLYAASDAARPPPETRLPPPGYRRRRR